MPRRNHRRGQPLPRSPHALGNVAMRAPQASPARGLDADFIRRQIVDGNLTRERSCDGKVRYKSYARAMLGRERAHRIPGFTGDLVVYPCPFCGGFHFAHTTPTTPSNGTDGQTNG